MNREPPTSVQVPGERGDASGVRASLDAIAEAYALIFAFEHPSRRIYLLAGRD